MNLLILGRGKTGSLVAEVAAERRHRVRIAGAKENAACAALAADRLDDIDAVIDFTAPHCVLAHIEACAKLAAPPGVAASGIIGRCACRLNREPDHQRHRRGRHRNPVRELYVGHAKVEAVSAFQRGAHGSIRDTDSRIERA